jgi:hypothetical protein
MLDINLRIFRRISSFHVRKEVEKAQEVVKSKWSKGIKNFGKETKS